MLVLLCLICCKPPLEDTGGADTALEIPPPDCEEGTRLGAAEGSEEEETAVGTAYTVRVPPGYDPAVAHPLVMVYAPAGANRGQTEQFTGLTPDLTEAGYLVSYSDHRSPSSAEVFDDLGSIPALVAEQWCVDEERVHFTGHSDGGSVSAVLAIYQEDWASVSPASIAPSAAGTNGDWLSEQPCPEALPVMVLHSSNDGLFPGFGAEAVAWWADCSGCGATPSEPDASGCVTYPDCTGGVAVTYCEGTGQHGSWPRLNEEMIRFFDEATAEES